MADKSKAQNADALRARKDIPKTVTIPRGKVTSNAVPAVHYRPGMEETHALPVHTLLPPRGFEAAIVSALVWLAKFARRKPGTSLVLAAAAGLAAGLCVRRI